MKKTRTIDPRVMLLVQSRRHYEANTARTFHPRRDAWLTGRRNARTQGA